jgi:hypothetical protein
VPLENPVLQSDEIPVWSYAIRWELTEGDEEIIGRFGSEAVEMMKKTLDYQDRQIDRHAREFWRYAQAYLFNEELDPPYDGVLDDYWFFKEPYPDLVTAKTSLVGYLKKIKKERFDKHNTNQGSVVKVPKVKLKSGSFLDSHGAVREFVCPY